MVGPEVSSLIAEAVFAIEAGANAEDLSLTIHAHPTLPETLMEAAEGVMGHATHMLNKSNNVNEANLHFFISAG